MNFLAQKRSKIFLDNAKVIPLNKDPFGDFYYRELASMTGSGSWSVNLNTHTVNLDNQARQMLKLGPGEVPTSKNALTFFTEDYQNLAKDLYLKCCKGFPFTSKLEMLTSKQKKFWAKVSGKPIYDKEKKIIGIQGVFQDITDEVKKEKLLENSLHTINFQNGRFMEFSQVISHNLISQAGNLEMTLDLLKASNSEKEKAEFNEHITEISKNLSGTLTQFNQLLKIQRDAQEKKVSVDFKKTLLNVQKAFDHKLFEISADVYSDFSEVPSIKYNPEFLDNIFRKLVSNAIKYASSDRKLVIDIFTYKENGRKCLLFKDNGIGIESHKIESIFNLYNKDSKDDDQVGFGLFILKNQIESMNGTITVTSILNQGTTFKITF